MYVVAYAGSYVSDFYLKSEERIGEQKADSSSESGHLRYPKSYQHENNTSHC